MMSRSAELLLFTIRYKGTHLIQDARKGNMPMSVAMRQKCVVVMSHIHVHVHDYMTIRLIRLIRLIRSKVQCCHKALGQGLGLGTATEGVAGQKAYHFLGVVASAAARLMKDQIGALTQPMNPELN